MAPLRTEDITVIKEHFSLLFMKYPKKKSEDWPTLCGNKFYNVKSVHFMRMNLYVFLWYDMIKDIHYHTKSLYDYCWFTPKRSNKWKKVHNYLYNVYQICGPQNLPFQFSFYYVSYAVPWKLRIMCVDVCVTDGTTPVLITNWSNNVTSLCF